METKVCIQCGRELAVDEFYIRTDTGTHRGECRDCIKRETARRYLANKPHHAALVARRYRTFGRFRRYGITQQIYNSALERQDGKCALCGVSEPGGKGVWHIDHAHEDGKTTQNGRFNQTDDPTLFRGLLCARCNISIGHYEALVDELGYSRLHQYLAARPLS